MPAAKVPALALAMLLSLPWLARAQTTAPPPQPPKASSSAEKQKNPSTHASKGAPATSSAASTAAAAPAANAPPAKPSLAALKPQNVTLGKEATIQITASGSPPPSIEEADARLPAGVTWSAPNLTIPATLAAGTYRFKFIAANDQGSDKNVLTVTVKAAQSPVSTPCKNTYAIALRVLTASDAPGLAQLLNGTFAQFSVTSAPVSPSQNSNPSGGASSSAPANAAGGSAPGSASQQNASVKQVLCISSTVSTDTQGNPAKYSPPKLPGKDGVPDQAQKDQAELQALVAGFDRPEFVGVGLGPSYLVPLSHVTDLPGLVAALPDPAPGIEISEKDAIGNDFLILHPTTSDLSVATVPASALAAQAAKVKHDLMALDAQLGRLPKDPPEIQKIRGLLAQVNPELKGPALEEAQTAVQAELERWDATHTVRLEALDPGEVAIQLGTLLFANCDVQVFSQQHAVTIRPSLVIPKIPGRELPEGLLVADEAFERNTIYERTEAEQAWQQKLQTDAASAAKQGSGGTAPPPPTTTTTSSTTVSTPAPSTSASSPTSTSVKPPAPIQIQTTTSTQTTNAASAPSSSTPATAPAATGQSATAAGANTPSTVASQNLPTGEPLPAGRVVRLFHLRQASNIATVINTIPNGPWVQPLSDFGNDDLLLILPPAPGQPDDTGRFTRMIASLDQPRPNISLQVWSYEISSEEHPNSSRRASVGQAQHVSDAYGEFTTAVQNADGQIQEAMRRGVVAAIYYIQRGQYLDPTFDAYLTGRFYQCVRTDRYCLGYEDALTFASADDEKTDVTLERFVVLLAAVQDEQARAMIDEAIGVMGAPYCGDGAEPMLCFPRFHEALLTLAEKRNLRQFRAALLDFLFYYKEANAYPDEFDPYYLHRSAQTLDGFLNRLIGALNEDLDGYLHAELDRAARAITKGSYKVGLANYGEVQVSSISGDPANVSGAVENYFNITPPALLKDVVGGLLGGAGGGGAGQTSGTGQGSGTAGNSGTAGTTATTPSTSATESAASTVASAAKLLTPWQAVALNALATASAPPQLMAQINAQTTLAVTPISLDTASAAELKINLQISNPTTTIDASKGTTSSFIRQDMANSVANYNVQTSVRVDSLKLFQVSSLSMDLTHAESPFVIPVVGWAWESVFGEVPVMKGVFTLPQAPKTIQNRTIAVVRAVVVPTAMDLGLSMPFRADSVRDPITRTDTAISSFNQTGNEFERFHQRLMHCILAGDDGCIASVRLSDTPEAVHPSAN